MKNTNSKAGAGKPVTTAAKNIRPENKDNLDSRANEEQDFKGNDVTHNKKDTKKNHLKKH